MRSEIIRDSVTIESIFFSPSRNRSILALSVARALSILARFASTFLLVAISA